MKKGKFKVVGLPNGSTHFVDPQFGVLDFKTMGEATLAQLHKKGCKYVQPVEEKPIEKKAAPKA